MDLGASSIPFHFLLILSIVIKHASPDESSLPNQPQLPQSGSRLKTVVPQSPTTDENIYTISEEYFTSQRELTTELEASPIYTTMKPLVSADDFSTPKYTESEEWRLAKTDVFPYVAVLKAEKTFCTGTILNADWILTAATCFQTANNTRKVFRILVRAEKNPLMLEDFVRRHVVEEYHEHPLFDYNTGFYNQMVAKVTPRMNSSRYLGRVIFPSVHIEEAKKYLLESFTGHKVILKGGSTDLYDCKIVTWKYNEPWYTLRFLEVSLMSNMDCTEFGNGAFDHFDLPNSVICAVPKGKVDSLSTDYFSPGDTGAPVVCRRKNKANFNLWGTFSTMVVSQNNRRTMYKFLCVFVDSLESVLYKYRFDSPYTRQ